MVSEITAPTNASVIAILSDAKKYGSERGKPTRHRMSSLLAPRDRSTSSSSGSIVAIPVATLTEIGKKATRKAVSTAGTVPIPNQRTRIGTTATLGMELNPISTGPRARYRSGDAPTATPNATPKTTAIANPTRVVTNV